MDLLGLEPTFDLDDPSWPILTPSPQRPPARIAAGSQVEDSLVSPGCIVRGDVARSVLAPGVLVEEGAKVRDSVVLQDAVVAAGATVDCAILDAEAHVGKGAEVGAPGAAKPKSCSSEAIAVAGRRARIRAGARVSPGARLEPR